MLLTLSTTHEPATDLGFLLHKNPARAQRTELSTGVAHVFYRQEAVLAELRAAGAARVVDLGAGTGALVSALLADPRFTEVVAVDVSARALAGAAKRLHLDRMPERQRARLTLLQSALTYTDARLAGYDAAVLMEVVEHVEPDRLPALEHAVFGAAAPGTVVVTTPNAEHNVRYPGLTGFRHPGPGAGSPGRGP